LNESVEKGKLRSKTRGRKRMDCSLFDLIYQFGRISEPVQTATSTLSSMAGDSTTLMTGTAHGILTDK